MVHVRTATLVGGRTDWQMSARPPAGEARWYVEEISGWFGGAGVRSEITASLAHGDFIERPTREGRSMTLHGFVACASADLRDNAEREISSVLADGEWGDLTGDAGDAPLTTRVVLDGAPQIVEVGRTNVRFQVPLRSDSPFLFGPERTVFLHPVGTGRGLEYPLFARTGALAYGTAIAAADPITNHGTVDAYDDYLVVGDFPGGWRLNVGGRVIEWPWPTVLPAPLLVQMTGRVWLGQANVTDRVSVRQWAPLPPGASVTPSLTALQGGTGWAEARHRDTYM